MTSPRGSFRSPISKDLQVQVFRRDGWICRWCGRPVIFVPAMRYLELLVRQAGFGGPLAYHDAHWTRRNAPLLDHMGAVIDHVEAHSTGGANVLDNFATACNKCNANKSNAPQADFCKKSPRRAVKGKYGEPHAHTIAPHSRWVSRLRQPDFSLCPQVRSEPRPTFSGKSLR